MQKDFSQIEHSYCFHPFNTLSVHASGHIRPCCVSQDSYGRLRENGGFQQAVNSEEMKELRKKMLQGERTKTCEKCWDLESTGIPSHRQIYNRIFEQEIEKSIEQCDEQGLLSSDSICYFDLTLGNICNLKCRSCHPWASSKWAEEGPTLPYSDWDEGAYAMSVEIAKSPWFQEIFEKDFFDDSLKNIQEINFLGGEPLIVREHLAFLSRIVDRGYGQNIKLSYNSNGTVLPDSLFEIWKKFKSIELNLSIDALAPLATYVRFPSKFEDIEKNVERLKAFALESKNINVQTHITLSLLNVHALMPLVQWCAKQYEEWHYPKKKYGAAMDFGYQNKLPHFNFVTQPDYLNVRHMPAALKEGVCEHLSELKAWVGKIKVPPWERDFIDKIDGIVEMVMRPRDDQQWKRFIANTRASDKFRKISITNYVDWAGDYF